MTDPPPPLLCLRVQSVSLDLGEVSRNMEVARSTSLFLSLGRSKRAIALRSSLGDSHASMVRLLVYCLSLFMRVSSYNPSGGLVMAEARTSRLRRLYRCRSTRALHAVLSPFPRLPWRLTSGRSRVQTAFRIPREGFHLPTASLLGSGFIPSLAHMLT